VYRRAVPRGPVAVRATHRSPDPRPLRARPTSG